MLDEPSIGLHPRDTHRLIKILRDLRDLGNTILVVEHDPDVMRAADQILDLGPGAGENGGKVIGEGTYDQILTIPGSLTGRYLSHELRIQLPQARRKPGKQQIKILGAHAHNLKNIDLDNSAGNAGRDHWRFGIGQVHTAARCALPVPGRAKKQQSNGTSVPSSVWTSLEGDDYIDDVVLVDQSPIGRTPRSNPVTYIKAFDGIRDWFASLPEVPKARLHRGAFLFQHPRRSM